ncbi:MAG TPA: chloride channel protein [Chloroflexota bacterium]|nr:chloride channel protein [Chloroflexota bacterium]
MIDDGGSGLSHPAGSRGKHAQAPHTATQQSGNVKLQMAALAIAAGLMAALAAGILHALVGSWQSLFLDRYTVTGPSMSMPALILLPAAGGLLAGTLVNGLAEEAKGAGISQIRGAVLHHGGRIRPRVAVVKLLATPLVLGSGGSAGIVGPMAQIGGALGSTVGQWRRLSESQMRTLLAAGTAAGVAAIINAPAAGFLFAIEVVLGEASLGSAWVVALSAAVAGAVTRLITGGATVLTPPTYTMDQPSALPLCLLLGILASWVGVAFTCGLGWMEGVFGRAPFPRFLAPAVGGLVVGLIGIAFPQVLGLGYTTINSALSDQLPAVMLAGLLLAKLTATCLTVGSGAPGGVIGPSLWMGTMFGGFLGGLAQALLPASSIAPGACALVGMGAVFAAAFHAPITAVVIVLELTGEHSLALPLAIACVSSSYLAGKISPRTVYNLGAS